MHIQGEGNALTTFPRHDKCISVSSTFDLLSSRFDCPGHLAQENIERPQRFTVVPVVYNKSYDLAVEYFTARESPVCVPLPIC